MAHQERGNGRLRLFDRVVGVPLLWLLGLLFFKRKKLPSQLNTLGVVKLAAIGDTVLLSAAIVALRQRYPDVKIIFFAGGSNIDTVRFIPGIDEIKQVSIKNPLAFISQLRCYKLDLLIDFEPWARLSALACFFSGASYRMGFLTPGQGRHWAYDRWVDHKRASHELENYLRLAVEGGATDKGAFPVIELPPVSKPFECNHNYVVFHMHSGGFNGEVKQWAGDCWQSLAKKFNEKGLSIVYTGTRGDYPEIASLIDSGGLDGQMNINLAGEFDLGDTGHILKGAALVISVNTGIMHLAAALDAKVLSLEGPTGPQRWGPIGRNPHRCRSCVSSHAGAGFLHLGFEYEGNPRDCMAHITVDSVWNDTQEMLEL